MLRALSLAAVVAVGLLTSACGPDLRVAGREAWLDATERRALAESIELDWRPALRPSDIVAALTGETPVDIAVVPRHLVPELVERQLLLQVPIDLRSDTAPEIAEFAVPVAAAVVGVDTAAAGGVDATRWSDWLSDASVLDTAQLEPRVRLGLALLAIGAYPDSRQQADLRRAAELARGGAGAGVAAGLGATTVPAETVVLELALVVPRTAADADGSFARVRTWSESVTLAPGWVRPATAAPRDWGPPIGALAREARLWRITTDGLAPSEAERLLEASSSR